MRLLRGTNQLCRIALDMGGGVRSCDITDLYIVVLLSDGTVAQLSLQETQDTPTLSLAWPELAKGSKVALISAYTDMSGLFVTELKEEEEGLVGVAVSGVTERHLSIDDEDELLYGDVDTLAAKLGKKHVTKQEAAQPAPSKTTPTMPTTPTKSYWCAVYREDGSLEIYQIPDFRKVFGVRNFSSCPRTLQDSGTNTTE